MDATLTTLIEVICAFGWCDEDEVLPDSSLDLLGFQSTDLAFLIGDIEREFGITLTDAEVMHSITVQDLHQLIASKL